MSSSRSRVRVAFQEEPKQHAHCAEKPGGQVKHGSEAVTFHKQRAHTQGQKVAAVDHHVENPRECADLLDAVPRRVYLDDGGRPEALERHAQGVKAEDDAERRSRCTRGRRRRRSHEQVGRGAPGLSVEYNAGGEQ